MYFILRLPLQIKLPYCIMLIYEFKPRGVNIFLSEDDCMFHDNY